MIRKPFSVAMALCLATLLGQQSLSQINYNDADWGIHPMEYSRVGTSGWQFLKLPTNARSAAMGGVRAALSYGDASAAFNNPASAADVKGFDLLFSSMKWVADIQYSGFSVVRNFGEWGSFGVNLVYLNYGEMVRTENRQSFDEFGNDLGITSVIHGLGTFSAYDLAIGILYTRQITDQLQLGGNVRLLEEKLDDARTRNWSVDIGTLYWTGLGSLRISMLGRNFGPDAEFASYNEQIKRVPVKVRMPMVFVIGAAYDILEMSQTSPHRLSVAAEYVKPNDGPEKVNVGAEYFFFYNFYLRGGYRFNYDEERYTFGLGAEYSVAEGVSFRLDYAYADIGRFNSVNMLTVGIGF